MSKRPFTAFICPYCFNTAFFEGAGKVLVNLTVGRDPVRSFSECAINSCDFWAEGKKDEKHALPLSLPCTIFSCSYGETSFLPSS